MSETMAATAPRNIVAVVVGNALEFYDFLTYAYFAVYIGKAFFPSHDPLTSLLASLATFGVGFVTRPVGGIIIGRMGDRVGRKPAMLLSFWLMGVSIIGLALTPSYARIGVAAPVIAVFFRMVQGFALGGEVGPTTAFLVEAAPVSRRGFYASLQTATQNLSVLISGLVGFALARALNEQQLQDYGWRIAFLLGALIVPFGLMIRSSLPETFHATDSHAERVPLRPYTPVIVIGLATLAAATIGTYIRTYITTYAIVTLHMEKSVAFAATIVVGLVGIPASMSGGAWSDRIGRRPIILYLQVLLLLLVVPIFYAITRYRTTGVFLVSTALLSALASIAFAPAMVWISESLPSRIRSGGFGIIYAVSIATFGGSTQYVVTWLIKTTQNAMTPAWYWTAATVIGIAAALAMRESAPAKVIPAKVLRMRPEIRAVDVGS